MNSQKTRPRAITAIAIVNTIAALLTVAFWGFVFVRVFATDTPPAELDAGSLSTTFGFMVADLSWATAVLIVSVVGLLRLRPWGWLAAQMVNILWLYSMTVIWSRDIHGGRISPGAILFLPFVPFSIWALLSLWKHRQKFEPLVQIAETPREG
jgi:hypothetical protein